MQTCLYEGKPVYAFDIIGENNIINFDIEKILRAASKQGLLKCSDCGEVVIFKFNNIEKRIPHFSHMNKGNTGNCSYAKETEEHIEGKRILLNRMRELYPDIYHQIRYKINSINRYADLYFQLDDQELIIEFQRSDLDFQIFEKKSQDYNLINFNNIWFLSGKKEDLKYITREYNLTFFQRINLYNSKETILFLDVENRTISMMRKILYENNDTAMDKMICKTYPVNNLIINIDGTIESDFEEFYETEGLKFIKEYEEKLSIDKKIISIRNKERYKKKYKTEIKPELIGISYRIYEANVDKLLNDYTEELFETVSLAYNNNITVQEIVKEILEDKINSGNKDAKIIQNKIKEFLK